jgi:hypothetical protein
MNTRRILDIAVAAILIGLLAASICVSERRVQELNLRQAEHNAAWHRAPCYAVSDGTGKIELYGVEWRDE